MVPRRRGAVRGCPVNFADEDYVRLYTRDTVTWKLLGWQGRTVLVMMLRSGFDRCGVFRASHSVTGCHDLSRDVTAVTELPREVVEEGLRQVMAEGIWVITESGLTWPGYVEAQTCAKTDRARKVLERRRNVARELSGEPVTIRDQMSRSVTPSHTESQPVTPSRADPIRSEEEKPPSPPDSPRPPPRDPMAHLTGSSPQQRPDVVQVFRAFVEAVGMPNRRMRRPGYECPDAAAIVEALATYGLDDCLTVARWAPRDGMVNGSDDDRRQRHDSVRYVFANPDAFARILRAAQNGEQRVSRHGGRTIAEIMAEAKRDPFEARAERGES